MLVNHINKSFLIFWSLADVISHIIPPINFTIDSTQSPSTITIIIKPFISFENDQKDISLDKNSSIKKRKNSSSSSLKTTIKRISPYLSDQTLNKHRLLTFKNLKRSVSPIINLNENQSLNILHSRTLLDIYRNKKQY